MSANRAEARKAIVMFLQALGRDPEADPNLHHTAERVVDAWVDHLIDGYGVDVPALLSAESSFAPVNGTGLVALKGVAVSTICPHHLLPARGTASVLYLPSHLVVGLGTLGRLVAAFSHRLTFQESIGTNVASSLVEHLGARGAACVLSMSHDCLSARGGRQSAASVDTIAFAGSFGHPGPDRDLAMLALSGRPAQLDDGRSAP
jgi:GTP cyclohydrolase IA